MHTRLLSSLAFSWLFCGMGRPRFCLVRGYVSHAYSVLLCVGAFACLLAFFCSIRILVARPRSPLCRIYYYTPTPYTYKASAFSPHVTRAGSCVPQREVPL